MPSEDTCCACPCGPCVTCAPLRDSKPPKQRGRHEMTTEQRTPCGLADTAKGSKGAAGAGGCRGVGVGRAEAFARSLHHKLRSLGGASASSTSTTSISSASSNGAAGHDSDDMEDSWSSAPSGPSSLTALRTLSTSSVDSASDMFYDLELVPQSPEEEVTSQELALMMAGSANRDDLHSNGNGPQSPQSDCSSDYFDTDCYEEERRAAPAVTQVSPLDGDAALSNGVAPPLVNGHGLANGSTNGVANGLASGPASGPASELASGATNGSVNGVANGPAKPKRPWNRVPHRFKAGTPEAMCEVSQLVLDDPDDDDEETKPCSRKTGLAKLSFPKSSQTLLQEGLIEQLKQGHDIPVELKNGLCPGDAEDSCGAPVAGSRGLTAMKEKARALDALATPEDTLRLDALCQDAADAADAVIKDVVDKDAVQRKEAELAANASAANKCRACGRQRVLDECPDCAADDRGDLSDGDKADHDDGSRPRVRRCSSLKTGKTPPGTPGRKKIVRFADVLGLDLADVRTFLDEIPKVPTSAYSDLQDVDQSDAVAADGCLPSGLPSGLPQLALAFNAVPSTDLPPFGARPVTRVLVPLFQQPGGLADFLDRVRDRQVCMENAVVADVALLSIAGQVRVRNLDFHKTVHLRYTTDGWRSFADLQASYVPNSCDGFSDKFTFTLFAGHTMSVGQRLEIAVRFQCKGQQYWDNNAGANYCFQCLPPSGAAPLMPLPSLHALGSPSDDGWKYLF
ncbi:glycogen-binding subunit 76A isoform X2 [Thrips palmi]|uniref:Glycogen-binding subunit 76A isoform X2 n=1 Tax=Thrips palmi TaxID=161013 RepID=A0A6P9A134_THRPL|nr:glycogen-binding subunit 76A isoform X2 [Thrips palmi]